MKSRLKPLTVSLPQIGVIQASQSIGYAGSILFVSHFAERSHKPRWVAAGAAAVGVSCLLPLFPHFAVWLPAYRYAAQSVDDGSSGTTSISEIDGLCRSGFPARESSPDCAFESVALRDGFNYSSSSSSHSDYHHPSSNGIAYVLFALSSVLAGLGNSPLNTVGMTYIDENVSKQDSAFYMGIPMSP